MPTAAARRRRRETLRRGECTDGVLPGMRGATAAAPFCGYAKESRSAGRRKGRRRGTVGGEEP
ncbi:hypothetical protein GCM10009532_29930 [Microbacterium aurantiacum]